MEQGPNRRTFLRGAAGAVGMGAVGVLAAKIRFAGATEPVGSQAVQIIPVFVVGGGKKDPQILVPGAAASPGDTVMWEPRDGVKRIVKIKFKKAGKNPFHKTQDTFDNPGDRGFSKRVLDDTLDDPKKAEHFEYEITVKPHDGPTKTLDPPLDIVPGA